MIYNNQTVLKCSISVIIIFAHIGLLVIFDDHDWFCESSCNNAVKSTTVANPCLDCRIILLYSQAQIIPH